MVRSGDVKVDLDIGTNSGNSVEKLESVAGFPSQAKAAGVLEPFVTKYLKPSSRFLLFASARSVFLATSATFVLNSVLSLESYNESASAEVGDINGTGPTS